MKDLIQKIRHQKFGEIRVIILNGTVYFVAIDAARALGFRDTSKAIRQHVQPQDKFTFSPDKTAGANNPGGVKIPHNAIFVNESGLWSLVLHSKLPKAQELQHWVTSEVLPAILRDGYYINPAVAVQNVQTAAPFSEFTKRETVEILLKLLPQASTPALKNQIIKQILLNLSPEFEKFLEKLNTELAD